MQFEINPVGNNEIEIRTRTPRADALKALEAGEVVFKDDLAELNQGDWAVVADVEDDGDTPVNHRLARVAFKTGVVLKADGMSFSRKTGRTRGGHSVLLAPTRQVVRLAKKHMLGLVEAEADESDRQELLDQIDKAEETRNDQIAGAAAWLHGQTPAVIQVMVGDEVLLEIAEWLKKRKVRAI